MLLNNRVYNRVEDFLMDDEFIRAILCHFPYSESYWEERREMNKDCSVAYEKARQILLAENPTVTVLTEDECLRLKERIFMTLGM